MSSDEGSSPPTKASLLKWWKAFSGHGGKDGQGRTLTSHQGYTPRPYEPPSRGLPQGKDGRDRVFGVTPDESLKYASVAISMLGSDGKPYVYGYVPIVVAKCGMYLKESATHIEGIFRVSGSSKRINALQAVFDAPPRYGKDLDWESGGYTQHDAASVLRRYLNMMPDPVIPQNLYHDFVSVLARSSSVTESIKQYRELISLLPPTSRYLLLYLLDFLSVFARSSDKNLMTASNLAVVFQPGLVSTRAEGALDGGAGGGAGNNGALLGFPGFHGGRIPDAATAGAAAQSGVGEHGRGKEVLEFLIEQQAHFVIGLEPATPAGEATVEGVLKSAKGTQKKALAAAGKKESDLLPPQQSTQGTSAAATAATVKREGSGRAYAAADLTRKGSEKSAERRRSRKAEADKDKAGENGVTVKRSRTLPSRKSDASTAVGPDGGEASPRSPPTKRKPKSSPSGAAEASPSGTPSRSKPNSPRISGERSRPTTAEGSPAKELKEGQKEKGLKSSSAARRGSR